MPLRPSSGPAPLRGMWAEVVRLRHHGERQQGLPETGYIVTQEVTDHRFRAFVTRSETLLFRDTDRNKGSIGAPLFDPSLLSWDERGIFIQGWEIVPGEPRSSQRVQVWQVRPLAAAPG